MDNTSVTEQNLDQVQDSNELTDEQIENFQIQGYDIDQWSTDEEIEIAVEDISADKEMAYRA